MRTSSPHRLIIAVLTLLATTAATFAWQVPRADATHDMFPSTSGTGCDVINRMGQYDAVVNWGDYDLKAYMRNAVSWTMTDRVAATTDLSAVEGGSEDMVFVDGYYTNYCGKAWSPNGTVVGTAFCVQADSNACEVGQAMWTNAYFDNKTLWQRRRTACHEIGHLIGLRHDSHNDNSWMQTNQTGSASYSWYERTQLINVYW